MNPKEVVLMRNGLAHRQSGASLVELLIAMALLSLLIAIFAPAAWQKRIAANEVVALGGMKAIYEAAAAFRSQEESQRYPNNLPEFRSGAEPYLEPVLATGQKGGYTFTYQSDSSRDAAAGFTAEAHPTVYRREGVRSYFIDHTGRLRVEDNGGFPGTVKMQPYDVEETAEGEVTP